jgi:hypothetical protein
VVFVVLEAKIKEVGDLVTFALSFSWSGDDDALTVIIGFDDGFDLFEVFGVAKR